MGENVIPKTIPAIRRDKYKDMQKIKKRNIKPSPVSSAAMCLHPYDEEAVMRFRALNIINDFKYLGFVVRSQFFVEVFDSYPELNSYQGVKKLEAFWSLRYFGEDVLDKLEVLIDNLKEE